MTHGQAAAVPYAISIGSDVYTLTCQNVYVSPFAQQRPELAARWTPGATGPLLRVQSTPLASLDEGQRLATALHMTRGQLDIMAVVMEAKASGNRRMPRDCIFKRHHMVQLRLAAPYRPRGTFITHVDFELHLLPCQQPGTGMPLLLGWLTVPGLLQRNMQLLALAKPTVTIGLQLDGTVLRIMSDLSEDSEYQQVKQEWHVRERTSESDATDELLLLQDVAKDLRASGMRQFFIRDRQRKAIGAAILVADFRVLDDTGSCCYLLRENLFLLLTAARAGQARVALNTRVEFVRVQAGYLTLQASLAAGSNELDGVKVEQVLLTGADQRKADILYNLLQSQLRRGSGHTIKRAVGGFNKNGLLPVALPNLHPITAAAYGTMPVLSCAMIANETPMPAEQQGGPAPAHSCVQAWQGVLNRPTGSRYPWLLEETITSMVELHSQCTAKNHGMVLAEMRQLVRTDGSVRKLVTPESATMASLRAFAQQLLRIPNSSASRVNQKVGMHYSKILKEACPWLPAPQHSQGVQPAPAAAQQPAAAAPAPVAAAAAAAPSAAAGTAGLPPRCPPSASSASARSMASGDLLGSSQAHLARELAQHSCSGGGQPAAGAAAAGKLSTDGAVHIPARHIGVSSSSWQQPEIGAAQRPGMMLPGGSVPTSSRSTALEGSKPPAAGSSNQAAAAAAAAGLPLAAAGGSWPERRAPAGASQQPAPGAGTASGAGTGASAGAGGSDVPMASRPATGAASCSQPQPVQEFAPHVASPSPSPSAAEPAGMPAGLPADQQQQQPSSPLGWRLPGAEEQQQATTLPSPFMQGMLPEGLQHGSGHGTAPGAQAAAGLPGAQSPGLRAFDGSSQQQGVHRQSLPHEQQHHRQQAVLSSLSLPAGTTQLYLEEQQQEQAVATGRAQQELAAGRCVAAEPQLPAHMVARPLQERCHRSSNAAGPTSSGPSSADELMLEAEGVSDDSDWMDELPAAGAAGAADVVMGEAGESGRSEQRVRKQRRLRRQQVQQATQAVLDAGGPAGLSSGSDDDDDEPLLPAKQGRKARRGRAAAKQSAYDSPVAFVNKQRTPVTGFTGFKRVRRPQASHWRRTATRDGQHCALVVLAEPLVLDKRPAGGPRPERLAHGQYSDVLRVSVVDSSGVAVSEEDLLSPAFWKAQARVVVDEGLSYQRSVFCGYQMQLTEPGGLQAFTMQCTVGSNDMPAWPFIVEALHEDVAVASELAAFVAIGAINGAADRYSYEAYLGSPAQPVPASVLNRREMLVDEWHKTRRPAV